MKVKKKTCDIKVQEKKKKENTLALNNEVTSLVISQIMMANPLREKGETGEVEQFLKSFQPKDDVEVLLAGQMMATHNLAMLMLARGGIEYRSIHQGEFKGANSAVKLLNVFNRQLEALKNYRGKTSTQKIVVEQVKVESGGQAVVGNVETGGRG